MDVRKKTADEWQAILDSELAKPCEEMNIQLVDLCVTSLLELKGIPDTWNEKQNSVDLRHYQKEVLVTNRFAIRRLRTVFIAAAILATLILGAVTLTASGFDFQEWLDSWFSKVYLSGETVEISDDKYDYTIIKANGEEVPANEDTVKIIPCIIPSYFPEELLKVVITEDKDGNQSVFFVFKNTKLAYRVFIDNIEITDSELIIINGNDWYFSCVDTIDGSTKMLATGYIKGIQYQIEHPDEKEIIKIIKSMEDH